MWYDKNENAAIRERAVFDKKDIQEFSRGLVFHRRSFEMTKGPRGEKCPADAIGNA